MLSFEKTVYGFSRMLNVLSGIALVLMMLLVFVNVALRAVWKPILGTYEFTGFLASITITFALAHCAAKKGHIAITIFADMLPPPGSGHSRFARRHFGHCTLCRDILAVRQVRDQPL